MCRAVGYNGGGPNVLNESIGNSRWGDPTSPNKDRVNFLFCLR